MRPPTNKQMKILHIIPNLNKGGAERLVTDIVRELKTRPEIQVRLVIFRDEIEYDVEDLRDVLHIIPSSVQLSLWKKNKLHVVQLQAFIDDFQPDIIHSHLFEAEIVSRSCFYPKAKWFSHGHGFFREFEQISFSRIRSKSSLNIMFEQLYILNRYKRNNGNTFIAVSSSIKEFLSKVFRGKCVVLFNAIQLNKFASVKADKLNNGKLNLLSVSRLDENKNHTLQIDTLAELKKRNIDVHLHIIGEGSLKNTILKRVKDLGLAKSVIFLGWIKETEKYYPKYDIFIHTAKKEALGLTILEAMSAGLPIVTLDGKGNRDLIHSGKNGFMINENKAAYFADAIENLWQNKQLYREVSDCAKKFAMEFDIEKYCTKLIGLYKIE